MSGQRFKPWVTKHAVRKSCSFCVYANRDTARTLVYRDHKVVAFESANPRAFKHLLVVPKMHYNTVSDLSPSEIPLLAHMLRVGKNLLDPSGAVFSKTMMRVEDKMEAHYPRSSTYADFEDMLLWRFAPRFSPCARLVRQAEDEANGMRFGFHLAPFHSVDHLHMHCFLLPFSRPFASLRYHPGSPWFVSTRKVMQDLARAPKVPPASPARE